MAQKIPTSFMDGPSVCTVAYLGVCLLQDYYCLQQYLQGKICPGRARLKRRQTKLEVQAVLQLFLCFLAAAAGGLLYCLEYICDQQYDWYSWIHQAFPQLIALALGSSGRGSHRAALRREVSCLSTSHYYTSRQQYMQWIYQNRVQPLWLSFALRDTNTTLDQSQKLEWLRFVCTKLQYRYINYVLT